jgi:hypothetical protein
MANFLLDWENKGPGLGYRVRQAIRLRYEGKGLNREDGHPEAGGSRNYCTASAAKFPECRAQKIKPTENSGVTMT